MGTYFEQVYNQGNFNAIILCFNTVAKKSHLPKESS